MEASNLKVAKAKEVVGLLVAVWLRLVCAIAHAGDGAAGGLGSAMCCKVAAMWPGAPAPRAGERGGGFLSWGLAAPHKGWCLLRGFGVEDVGAGVGG